MADVVRECRGCARTVQTAWKLCPYCGVRLRTAERPSADGTQRPAKPRASQPPSRQDRIGTGREEPDGARVAALVVAVLLGVLGLWLTLVPFSTSWVGVQGQTVELSCGPPIVETFGTELFGRDCTGEGRKRVIPGIILLGVAGAATGFGVSSTAIGDEE